MATIATRTTKGSTKKIRTKPSAPAPARRAGKGRATALAKAKPRAPTRAKPAPPPPPPPPASSRALLTSEEALDAHEIPGDAIDGTRLSRAIRYAGKVAPKDSDLVFTLEADGQPVVSGHDPRRCHSAFLSLKSAFHLRAAVPRGEALHLADALDGLASPLVRIDADGLVLIRHGVGQPAIRFRIGSREITFAWAPPSQSGRRPAAGALRIQAAWQAAACRWGCAIVHTWQSVDGIEWCTLTDAETGELLARAVLAEDGKDLFPEDDRQTEIPGSRTAGETPFERAVREGAERAEAPLVCIDGTPVAGALPPLEVPRTSPFAVAVSP